MIGKFARLAKEGKPLTVHGDGEYLRDYIHVSDVAKAVSASLESKVRNETFNVGTGKNITVNQVVDMIKELKPDVEVEYEPHPKGYAKDTLADIVKVKKLLGWSPKIFPEEGIKATLTELLK